MTVTEVSKQFFAKKGSRFNNQDAQILGPVLDSLHNSPGGITASRLWDAGKDKSNPSYNYFEHDRDKAAHEYNLIQAREIIRSIEIVVVGASGERQVTRGYQNVVVSEINETGDTVSERRYVPVEVIQQAPDLKEQVLDRFLSDITALRNRYHSCRDVYENPRFQPVFEAIDEALAAD